MWTALKITGAVLIALASLVIVLLGLAAAKGFFTTKGLIIDLPAKGRVFPASLASVLALVLTLALLGSVMLVAARRTHRRQIPTPPGRPSTLR